jgi:hypothetical protein
VAELGDRHTRQKTTRRRWEHSLESAHCVMGNPRLGQILPAAHLSCPAASALMNPSKADVNGNTPRELIKVACCGEAARGDLGTVRDTMTPMPDAVRRSAPARADAVSNETRITDLGALVESDGATGCDVRKRCRRRHPRPRELTRCCRTSATGVKQTTSYVTFRRGLWTSRAGHTRAWPMLMRRWFQ